MTGDSPTIPSGKALCCEACGRPDAERLGDRAWCLDCYAERGSCCAEFDKEDAEETMRLKTDGSPNMD